MLSADPDTFIDGILEYDASHHGIIGHGMQVHGVVRLFEPTISARSEWLSPGTVCFLREDFNACIVACRWRNSFNTPGVYVKYVVLLRGINVGGHRKIPMAQLRELLQSLGHADVTTYIQSGNAIVSSDRDNVEELASEIETRIERVFGFEVSVLLRTPQELAAVLTNNPFLGVAASETELYAAFLSRQPEPDRVRAIDAAQFEPDQFALGERVVYLRYPNGAGRAKLTHDILERRLAVRATARNWNTVNKLLTMSGE